MDTDPTRFAAFNTPAHDAAQARCRHVIHCAVNAETRAQVWAGIDYARSVGDMAAFTLLMAQLDAPCLRNVKAKAAK